MSNVNLSVEDLQRLQNGGRIVVNGCEYEVILMLVASENDVFSEKTDNRIRDIIPRTFHRPSRIGKKAEKSGGLREVNIQIRRESRHLPGGVMQMASDGSHMTSDGSHSDGRDGDDKENSSGKGSSPLPGVMIGRPSLHSPMGDQSSEDRARQQEERAREERARQQEEKARSDGSHSDGRDGDDKENSSGKKSSPLPGVMIGRPSLPSPMDHQSSEDRARQEEERAEEERARQHEEKVRKQGTGKKQRMLEKKRGQRILGELRAVDSVKRIRSAMLLENPRARRYAYNMWLLLFCVLLTLFLEVANPTLSTRYEELYTIDLVVTDPLTGLPVTKKEIRMPNPACSGQPQESALVSCLELAVVLVGFYLFAHRFNVDILKICLTSLEFIIIVFITIQLISANWTNRTSCWKMGLDLIQDGDKYVASNGDSYESPLGKYDKIRELFLILSKMLRILVVMFILGASDSFRTTRQNKLMIWMAWCCSWGLLIIFHQTERNKIWNDSVVMRFGYVSNAPRYQAVGAYQLALGLLLKHVFNTYRGRPFVSVHSRYNLVWIADKRTVAEQALREGESLSQEDQLSISQKGTKSMDPIDSDGEEQIELADPLNMKLALQIVAEDARERKAIRKELREKQEKEREDALKRSEEEGTRRLSKRQSQLGTLRASLGNALWGSPSLDGSKLQGSFFAKGNASASVVPEAVTTRVVDSVTTSTEFNIPSNQQANLDHHDDSTESSKELSSAAKKQGSGMFR